MIETFGAVIYRDAIGNPTAYTVVDFRTWPSDVDAFLQERPKAKAYAELEQLKLVNFPVTRQQPVSLAYARAKEYAEYLIAQEEAMSRVRNTIKLVNC